jgi:hypothetical protein
VARAQKNIDPWQIILFWGEPEMRAHSQSLAPRRNIQTHQMA